jgi:N-acetylneuraminic acid mutarotase
MPTPRFDFAIGVVHGRIYAMGGVSPHGYTNVTEEYDPIADTWRSRASMPTPRPYHTIGVVHGRIYAIGGRTPSGAETGENSNVVDVYDPATNTWTSQVSLPTARRHLAIGVVASRYSQNTLFSIGGVAYGNMVSTTNEALIFPALFYVHVKN